MFQKVAHRAVIGLWPVITPLSLTSVLTLAMPEADASSRSISGITASLNGIEMADPRMSSARMPSTAAARSVVANAL